MCLSNGKGGYAFLGVADVRDTADRLQYALKFHSVGES